MGTWSVAPSRHSELMDDPSLAATEHLAALAALARINAVSGTAARLAAGVRRIAGTTPAGRGLHVVDVACGRGDVTLALGRLLAQPLGSAAVRVTGIDVSPRAIEAAVALARRMRATASFLTTDVLQDGCPPCDVAVSSLFLHHLDDDPARALLGTLAAAARIGVVISDLVRSRVGLLLAVLGTTVLSSSRVARVDGPLSVRAARTPCEYRRLLDSAGLGSATVSRVWPERVLIEWRRPCVGGTA